MRTIVMAAGFAACLGLSACEQSKSEATETTEAAAAAPRKSLSRPAPLYAGQEQILQVDTASVETSKSGVITLKASGKTDAPGFYQLAFLPRINAAAPPDGIYDVDVIGYRPQGAAAQVTPVEVSGQWANAPKERLKGVRFITKTNEVVAMLPTG